MACTSDKTTATDGETAQQAQRAQQVQRSQQVQKGHDPNDGQDHSGHDHAGHDHAGHDHGDAGEVQEQGPSKEEMAAIRAKRLEQKSAPITAAEKKIAEDICTCMNKYPVFKRLAKAKDQASFNKIAGDKKEDVKALQDCHNDIMPDAVKNLGDRAGIFAHKARRHMNDTCLNANDGIWMMIGKYLISQSPNYQEGINKKLEKAKTLGNRQ